VYVSVAYVALNGERRAFGRPVELGIPPDLKRGADLRRKADAAMKRLSGWCISGRQM